MLASNEKVWLARREKWRTKLMAGIRPIKGHCWPIENEEESRSSQKLGNLDLTLWSVAPASRCQWRSIQPPNFSSLLLLPKNDSHRLKQFILDTVEILSKETIFLIIQKLEASIIFTAFEISQHLIFENNPFSLKSYLKWNKSKFSMIED